VKVPPFGGASGGLTLGRDRSAQEPEYFCLIGLSTRLPNPNYYIQGSDQEDHDLSSATADMPLTSMHGG
jgi:hypothetical protein